MARFFVEHPLVDVVYGHRIVINDRDEEVGQWVLPPFSPAALVWNNYVPQETLFWHAASGTRSAANSMNPTSRPWTGICSALLPGGSLLPSPAEVSGSLSPPSRTEDQNARQGLWHTRIQTFADMDARPAHLAAGNPHSNSAVFGEVLSLAIPLPAGHSALLTGTTMARTPCFSSGKLSPWPEEDSRNYRLEGMWRTLTFPPRKHPPSDSFRQAR